MKKIIYLLTLSIIACATNEKYVMTEGEVDVDYLFKSPNTSWFQKNYESYIVDEVIQIGDFSKLNETFPELKLIWNMKNGIRNLIEFLETYLLNKNKFKQREFYRLQQLEFLLSTKQLDKDLIWTKNA